MYNIIFAISKNGVVGSSSAIYGMPWHYPEDLKYYQQKTINQKCIMGHNTYKMIGKALPNRETFVLSNNKKLVLDDCQVINDPFIFNDSTDDIWICGGPTIYRLYWEYATYIYITRINSDYEGDVYFTDFDLSNFELIKSDYGKDEQLIFEVWRKNV